MHIFLSSYHAWFLTNPTNANTNKETHMEICATATFLPLLSLGCLSLTCSVMYQISRSEADITVDE